MRRPLLLVTAALALAGVGATGYAASGRPTSASASAKHATVKTRHGALGTYLVDGSGRTLYRFLKDTSRRSRCSGACAQAWPPLITRERPEAEGGAKASRLSSARRKGGALQVVYGGRPLYRFAPDSKPGATGGQGANAFGGHWYVVAPSGRVIRGTGAPAPPSPSGY
jgi:predicted lipoprotein with Yx(FWY)xxD motif